MINKKTIKWIIGSSLIFFSLSLFFFLYKQSFSSSLPIDTNKFSDFGTFISGILATTATIAGFILLIETFKMQKEELEFTRDEFQAQNKTLKIEQFDNTFFNLLKNLKDITPDIEDLASIKEEIEFYYGYIQLEEFEKDYQDIRNNQANHERLEFIINSFSYLFVPSFKFQDKTEKATACLEEIRYFFKKNNNTSVQLLRSKLAYRTVFEKSDSMIGHYLRTTYHILKYIKKAEDREMELTESKEEFESTIQKYQDYANLLQAQLSTVELFILFYNGLGFLETKKLLHYYSFLENLPVEQLLDESHDAFYEKWVTNDGNVYREIRFKKRAMEYRIP